MLAALPNPHVSLDSSEFTIMINKNVLITYRLVQEIYLQPLHYNFSLAKNFAFRNYLLLAFRAVLRFQECFELGFTPCCVFLGSWNHCVWTSPGTLWFPLVSHWPLSGHCGSERPRDASWHIYHHMPPYTTSTPTEATGHSVLLWELLGGCWPLMSQLGLCHKYALSLYFPNIYLGF